MRFLSVTRAHLLAASSLLSVPLACGDGGFEQEEDAAPGPGGKADGTDGVLESLLCDATTWLDAVPISGDAIMAYAGKAYLFAQDGLTWAVVQGETSTTQPIPLPEGITEMRSVVAEIAPSGRPFVTFRSEAQHYAAIFDGQEFIRVTATGGVVTAHADAQEHFYTVDSSGGLVEYAPGEAPLFRGGLLANAKLWGVGADGTVHVFHEQTRPSTIHPGDTANDLVVRGLPHGTLSWGSPVTVASNEGWGFNNVHFAAAPDGSLHVAYGLTYGVYHFRSLDGETWEQGNASDIVSHATMVDPASPVFDQDPTDVKGGIALLTAQSFEHATVTLAYNGGSFSVPGYYHLRRCPPFSGLGETWPAERLALASAAFAPNLVAVDERGLTTIVTPYGARQNVVDGDISGCDGDCPGDTPDDSGGEDVGDEVPACGATEVHGPIEVPVNLQTAAGRGHPLMPTGDTVRVFLENGEFWMQASLGSASTVHLPEAYTGANFFRGEHSMSGGRALLLRFGSELRVSPNDGPPVVVPCSSSSSCTARVAGDGHLWVAASNLHEQVGDGFENRGGFPVTASVWDVDDAGNVIVAGGASLHNEEYMSFWQLAPGAAGWAKVGGLPGDVVADVSAQIEGGFQFGDARFASDGSFHLLSSARCVGTGTHNKAQFYLRSSDYQTWDVEALPAVEQLANNEDHVAWSYGAMWAGSYETVRYILMTSNKPGYDGWDWTYPGSRQVNLVERCRNDEGAITFAQSAQLVHPGWTIPGFHAFAPNGTASILTHQGLSQAF